MYLFQRKVNDCFSFSISLIKKKYLFTYKIEKTNNIRDAPDNQTTRVREIL